MKLIAKPTESTSLGILTMKGGKGSGWFAPPKGTHSGEKHRSVGSGKVKVKAKAQLSIGVGGEVLWKDGRYVVTSISGDLVFLRPKGDTSGAVDMAHIDALKLAPIEQQAELDMGDKWPHEINPWTKEHWQEWKDSLTGEWPAGEDGAMDMYVQDGYSPVNNYLRFDDAPDAATPGLDDIAYNLARADDPYIESFGQFWDSEFRDEYLDDALGDTIDLLDSAIAKGSVPQDMVTYRGWGSGSEVGQLNVGETFNDGGFVSTSMSKRFVDKHFGSGEPVARIHLKKGQSAATNVHWFGATDEGELLLPRDLTFRIIGKTADIIDMEIVE